MNEVGVRLKVAASGLENIGALTKELNNAGVETTALDKKAAELAAELKRLADTQALIDAFKRQKTATTDAATALTAAKTAAAALGKELSATEAPTAAQEKAFNKARTAARDASAGFDEQRLKLQQLRTQLDAAGASTGSLAAAQVRVNQATDATRAKITQLEGEYRQVGQAATQAAAVQVEASGKAARGLDDVGRQLGLVRNLAGAAIGGQFLSGMIGDVSKTADVYANLGARIKLVTIEGGNFGAAFQGVFDVATRTNSSLEATGTLFARIAEAGKKLGVSQADALRLTETINQAVQLSGSSAEASNAAITQLVQGLQSGVLRGDEFNSVMEQAPRLAKALADGLGVTTGELRKMAEAGALSAETVIGALKGQSATLQKEFAVLPATVGRAIENLSTNWTRYVGEVDKANGASAGVAKIIGLLANNLDAIGLALTEAGKGFAAYTALRIAESFNDKARAVKLAAAELAAENLVQAENTRQTAANAAAKRGSAAAWGEVAVALKGETAAVAADTAALAGNSTATTANTAAKRASIAATASAAAGLASVGTAAAGAATGLAASGAAAGATVGRFAAMRVAGLALVSTLGAIGGAVAIAALAWDGFKAAGTWIGETAAKLAGYRDRTDDLAKSQQAAATAARQTADAQAQLAQQTGLAASKALGLNDVSRKLVADFEELRTTGTSAAEALEKLAKDLDLGSTKGIQDAVTALDVLQQKGKITGEQVRQALAQALDGKDLAIFETQARAAFDGSEQGARRLAATLDAVANESIKRAGTSVQELKTGFSAAMNRAINDTDVLAKTLKNLGVKGEEAGNLLAKSIDKQLEAANTERALQAVRDKLREMGAQGLISGDQVAAGLDKVNKKSDEAREGINSVAEAARKLGIQTAVDLAKTASDFKASWERISSSTEVSLAEKIKGFARYRDAAMAANKGVESSEVALQRQTLETQAATAGLGNEFAQAMGKSDKALRGTKTVVNELAAGFEHVQKTIDGAAQSAIKFASVLESTKYNAQKFAVNADGSTFAAGAGDGSTYTPTVPEGEIEALKAASDAALQNFLRLQSNAMNGKAVNGAKILTTGVSPAFAQQQRDTVAAAMNDAFRVQQAASDKLKAALAANAAAAKQAKADAALQKTFGASAADVAAARSAVAGVTGSTSHTVTIQLPNGKQGTVSVASALDGANLSNLLAQLAQDQARAGG